MKFSGHYKKKFVLFIMKVFLCSEQDSKREHYFFMTKNPFTIDYYEKILREINESQYAPVTFSCHSLETKKIYIRHDIDHDVDIAYKMALTEQKLGITSTYLVLLRTKNYNVFVLNK